MYVNILDELLHELHSGQMDDIFSLSPTHGADFNNASGIYPIDFVLQPMVADMAGDNQTSSGPPIGAADIDHNVLNSPIESRPSAAATTGVNQASSGPPIGAADNDHSHRNEETEVRSQLSAAGMTGVTQAVCRPSIDAANNDQRNPSKKMQLMSRPHKQPMRKVSSKSQ